MQPVNKRHHCRRELVVQCDKGGDGGGCKWREQHEHERAGITPTTNDCNQDAMRRSCGRLYATNTSSKLLFSVKCTLSHFFLLFLRCHMKWLCCHQRRRRLLHFAVIYHFIHIYGWNKLQVKKWNRQAHGAGNSNWLNLVLFACRSLSRDRFPLNDNCQTLCSLSVYFVFALSSSWIIFFLLNHHLICFKLVYFTSILS